jgi:Putative DNA-binding domain
MSNASALAQQQRALLSAIFTINNIATQAINTPATAIANASIRGLQAYQANAHASAQRSLQTAYPVIAQLIGDDAFEHLAHDFWAQHPPTRGDLAQWGGELPGFIADISALQTEPYLCDVAKAEWALHTAATSADMAANFATFSLLTEQDPDVLTLQLAPGTALIHSQYPIASIITAHLYARPSFEVVGHKLRQNTPETALIWRQGLRPMASICTVREAAFLEGLLAGKSLLSALNAATSSQASTSSADFDFSNWLSMAVENGLLLGAQLL